MSARGNCVTLCNGHSTNTFKHTLEDLTPSLPSGREKANLLTNFFNKCEVNISAGGY